MKYTIDIMQVYVIVHFLSSSVFRLAVYNIDQTNLLTLTINSYLIFFNSIYESTKRKATFAPFNKAVAVQHILFSAATVESATGYIPLQN